ncbi:MAG: 50S ribosomal protein L28 [Burkholderiaceae bacterium]|nr:MAG: 50S ribosomal protein L28 [Burkholderiaceae bacterium]
MARVCQITGKNPGRKSAYQTIKIKEFLPSLHQKRFWLESEKRWVRLRLSSAAIRTIDKKGIENVMPELLNKKEV